MEGGYTWHRDAEGWGSSLGLRLSLSLKVMANTAMATNMAVMMQKVSQPIRTTSVLSGSLNLAFKNLSGTY
jgi:hypothetical protein